MTKLLTKLLTVSDVAEMTGNTEHRIYTLVREGIIPAVFLGRQIRFSPQKIQEFIENGGKRYPGGWKKDAQK